jgi:hypothetical protein
MDSEEKMQNEANPASLTVSPRPVLTTESRRTIKLSNDGNLGK